MNKFLITVAILTVVSSGSNAVSNVLKNRQQGSATNVIRSSTNTTTVEECIENQNACAANAASDVEVEQCTAHFNQCSEEAVTG